MPRVIALLLLIPGVDPLACPFGFKTKGLTCAGDSHLLRAVQLPMAFSHQEQLFFDESSLEV